MSVRLGRGVAAPVAVGEGYKKPPCDGCCGCLSITCFSVDRKA